MAATMLRSRVAPQTNSLLPHRRHLSSSPLLLRWLATPLPHRTLLRVTGSEAESFLQGLTTSDVAKAESALEADAGEGKALSTAFLNAPGRTLFDAFVLPLPALSSVPGGQPTGGYWVDHPRYLDPHLLPTTVARPPATPPPPEGTKVLWQHLRRYILRSKVQLALEPRPSADNLAFSVWAVFDQELAGKLRGTKGVRNTSALSVKDEVTEGAKEALGVGTDEKAEEVKKAYEDEESRVANALVDAGAKVWRDIRAPGMGLRVLVPSSTTFRASRASRNGTF